MSRMNSVLPVPCRPGEGGKTGEGGKARREGLIPGIVAGNTKALAKMQQDGRATRWSKQKSKRK